MKLANSSVVVTLSVLGSVWKQWHLSQAIKLVHLDLWPTLLCKNIFHDFRACEWPKDDNLKLLSEIGGYSNILQSTMTGIKLVWSGVSIFPHIHRGILREVQWCPLYYIYNWCETHPYFVENTVTLLLYHKIPHTFKMQYNTFLMCSTTVHSFIYTRICS